MYMHMQQRHLERHIHIPHTHAHTHAHTCTPCRAQRSCFERPAAASQAHSARHVPCCVAELHPQPLAAALPPVRVPRRVPLSHHPAPVHAHIERNVSTNTNTGILKYAKVPTNASVYARARIFVTAYTIKKTPCTTLVYEYTQTPNHKVKLCKNCVGMNADTPDTLTQISCRAKIGTHTHTHTHKHTSTRVTSLTHVRTLPSAEIVL